jgi:hypothetical protein
MVFSLKLRFVSSEILFKFVKTFSFFSFKTLIVSVLAGISCEEEFCITNFVREFLFDL